MPKSGTINHIDISVGYPEKSIPFYDTLLTSLGFKRMETDHPDFSSANPSRAWWSIEYADGGQFGIEVRPAHEEKKDMTYDRYRPGPHHIAFHADSPMLVDIVHSAITDSGGKVLDPPTDYSGQPGYSNGYYAAFFADPDGVKLEVVYVPETKAHAADSS